MKTVYLAGPITGQTTAQANDWRTSLCKKLDDIGIRGISPLRCEPKTDGVYKLFYDDICFGTPKAIAGKNFYDVKNCDLTLAYLPQISVGTIIEIGWATSLQKPIVVVSDLDGIKNHPLIQECTNWIVPDFEHAYAIISGLMGDYV